jgi:hypothetical protein
MISVPDPDVKIKKRNAEVRILQKFYFKNILNSFFKIVPLKSYL